MESPRSLVVRRRCRERRRPLAGRSATDCMEQGMEAKLKLARRRGKSVLVVESEGVPDRALRTRNSREREHSVHAGLLGQGEGASGASEASRARSCALVDARTQPIRTQRVSRSASNRIGALVAEGLVGGMAHITLPWNYLSLGSLPKWTSHSPVKRLVGLAMHEHFSDPSPAPDRGNRVYGRTGRYWQIHILLKSCEGETKRYCPVQNSSHFRPQKRDV